MKRQAITDFPLYSVNTLGEVFREGREMPLAQTATEKGYMTVNLSMGHMKSRRMVHRVVLEAFVGKRPDGMHGCHMDGNPANNELSNLAWVTPTENESHKILHGTNNVGERNGFSRLTTEQVGVIRKMRREGGRYWGATDIAKKFGVDLSTVIRVAAGRSWKCVEVSQ